MNSLKHGLSRIGTTPPAAMADAIASRMEQLRPDYRPAGPAQELAFERLCAESVRLDACERRILVARAEQAERAAESWDDDRAADAAELGSKLASRPEVIQPRLLQGRHGVLWLLERWDEVADALRLRGGWTQGLWERAMDLLGVSALARQATPHGDLDAGDGGLTLGLTMVKSCAQALRNRLESHLDARDDRARADAVAGLGAGESPELRRLERYAADARRQVARARAELDQLRAHRSPARPAVVPPPPPDRSPAPAPPNEPAVPAPAPSSPVATAPDRTSPRGAISAALRDRLPSPAPASNRRTRRAQAALARRS